MGAGYKVILGDLDAAASAFSTESADFSKLRSRMSPPPVDGGDGAVNAGIEAVLALFAAGNAALVKAMHEHGEKLRTCHDSYKEDDSDVVALYNKLSELT
jgi:Family of unknown function (DUF6317)